MSNESDVVMVDGEFKRCPAVVVLAVNISSILHTCMKPSMLTQYSWSVVTLSNILATSVCPLAAA